MDYRREVEEIAGDILGSPGMELEKTLVQHGTVTVYEHSYAVTLQCLRLCDALHMKLDRKSLIRGALLHDYFLYDWHIKDESHRWHGFHHGAKALENAMRDFELTETEKDMIRCHMFPLTMPVPKTKEGKLLCLADKYVATIETVRGVAGKLRG